MDKYQFKSLLGWKFTKLKSPPTPLFLRGETKASPLEERGIEGDLAFNL